MFKLSMTYAFISIETKRLHGLCLKIIHEQVLVCIWQRSDRNVDVE